MAVAAGEPRGDHLHGVTDQFTLLQSGSVEERATVFHPFDKTFTKEALKSAVDGVDRDGFRRHRVVDLVDARFPDLPQRYEQLGFPGSEIKHTMGCDRPICPISPILIDHMGTLVFRAFRCVKIE